VVDGGLLGVLFGQWLAEFAAALAAGREWVSGIVPDPSLATTDGDEATVLRSACH
jgi:hypothetical protein